LKPKIRSFDGRSEEVSNVKRIWNGLVSVRGHRGSMDLPPVSLGCRTSGVHPRAWAVLFLLPASVQCCAAKKSGTADARGCTPMGSCCHTVPDTGVRPVMHTRHRHREMLASFEVQSVIASYPGGMLFDRSLDGHSGGCSPHRFPRAGYSATRGDGDGDFRAGVHSIDPASIPIRSGGRQAFGEALPLSTSSLSYRGRFPAAVGI
jgi:hypothetical protein